MYCLQVILVRRFVWYKTNVSPPGFHTFALDTEDIVVGYFTTSAEERYTRGMTLFDLKVGNRSSVWSFPRGTPYREQASSKESILIKSVWNIDMLLNFLSTCLQPGDTLCDMFAGTGSASVAALLLGCHTLIIEKDPKHLKLCKERMNAHVNKTADHLDKFQKLPDEQKNCEMPEVYVIFISNTYVTYSFNIDDLLREVWKVQRHRCHGSGSPFCV